MQSGQVQHSFGSYDLLTEEAKLIRAKAEAGMGFYQYFWGGLVLLELYPERIINEDKQQAIMREGKDWVAKAAENQYPDAQIYMIEDFLYNYPQKNSVEDKGKALRYANELVAAGVVEGRYWREQVAKLPTDAEVIAAFFKRVAAFRYLSEQDINILAKALITGQYYDARVSQITVQFDKDRALATEMFRYLVEDRVDIKAAYYLARLLQEDGAEEQQTEAIYYFQWAADRGIPEAMFWLGRHYICNGNKAKGRVYLDRAINNGHPNAQEFAQQTRLRRISRVLPSAD